MVGAVGSWWMAGLMVILAGASGAGCSDSCCTTDGFPINLLPRTSVDATGLLAKARDPNGDPTQTFQMSIDTGSSLTFFRRQSTDNRIVERDFDILDAQPPADLTSPVVRGQFRQIDVLPIDLDPTGPDAVLGGAFLQNFSIQLDFARPAMTFWARQGASDGFLDAAGFAVLHFNLLGGVELTADSRPDFLGVTGPVETPPTRVVLRACGGATAFDPDAPEPERCCTRGDEVKIATGANLALLVATGVGPLVLAQSAWDRIDAVQPTPLPSPTAGPSLLIPALSAPVTAVQWSTLPRIALVNQELDDSTNQGACVDLGRARRLEWVERHQSEDGATGACALPCDTDPRDSSLSQNAAAYLELGGDIPVAILPDSTPFLQALRAEIRPQGPELDGLIGANLLAQTSIEIDYPSKPGRALIHCLSEATRATCWSSPRCPRLGSSADVRGCFGLPRRRLPVACETSVCG